MALAAGAANATDTLAIDGGAPLRQTPLHGGYWGTAYYDAKEAAGLVNVVETGSPFRWAAGSLKVLTFEKEFAQRMNTRYALAVTSGTAALEVAYSALGIGPGDEVILPAWAWHSDATAVVRAGALPVFAEIDESFNIDPNDIEHRITPNTKVLVAVHLQGAPADMEKILAIARKHNLKVLEDSAQAVGASYQGKPTGSMGDRDI
jgi:8-amino-3,8-dideoxy-alpha-D-manno-octulosonate transaminase